MAKINVITGKGNAPSSVALNQSEVMDFKAWFDHIVAQKMEVDVDIAQSFAKNYEFYLNAAQVAKAYMTTQNEPFYPLEPTQGGYGVKEITPQDIGAITWPSTTTGLSSLHSWQQTIALGASVNWANVFGTAGAPISPSNTASYHSVLAFHGLISYQPGTRLQQLQQAIGSYIYPVVSVEEAAKIEKPLKKFKLIPLESGFLLIPTNNWYMQASFEKAVFGNAESYVEEIAILGLVFAEYSYLRAQIS